MTPVQGIFGSATLQRRGLDLAPQWNRVLDRLPELSEALTACAADRERCTAPWMDAWLQAREAVAGLDRDGQLHTVNRFFNRKPYKTDRATYRTSEYWAAPDEFMAYSGDCEDYAIAKFFALRGLGFANQELRIAVVYDKLRRIGHAVLAVYTDGDILILNNQTDIIASHARYDNFVPWYLVNETTLWASAGPTLSSLIPGLAVAGPAADVEANRPVAKRWRQAQAPSRVPTPAPAATPTATPTAAFRVQLGAFRIAENAPALWRRLSMTQPDLLGGLRQRIQRAGRGERVLHLLQVGPLADTEAAKSLCAALAARGVDCLVVKS